MSNASIPLPIDLSPNETGTESVILRTNSCYPIAKNRDPSQVDWGGGLLLERDLASLHKAHRITGFGPRTPESGPKISPVNWSIGEKTDLNGLVLRSIDLLVSVGSTNHRLAPSPSNTKIGPGPLGQTILRANKRHTHEGYKKTTEEQEKGSANRH